MNTQQDGGPAFPRTGYELKDGSWVEPQQGMSLRDYFAAAALQGIISSMANLSIPTALKMLEDVGGQDNLARIVAASASKYADAMLAARERRDQQP